MRISELLIVVSLWTLSTSPAMGQSQVSDSASRALAKIETENLLDICERLQVGEKFVLHFDFETKNETKILKAVQAGWSDFEQSSELVPGTSGARTLLKLSKGNVATSKIDDLLTSTHLVHLESMKKQGWDFSMSNLPATFLKITASQKKTPRKDVLKTYTTFANGLSNGHINFFEMRGMYGQRENVQLSVTLGVKLAEKHLFDRIQELTIQPSTSIVVAEKDVSKGKPCGKPTKQFRTDGFVRKQNKIKMTSAYRVKLLTDRFEEELKGAQLSANYVGNKIDGYKIDSLQHDSVLCFSGFQIGDVIKSLHGKELTDAGQVIRLLQEIRHADRFLIESTRAGKKISTTIEVK